MTNLIGTVGNDTLNGGAENDTIEGLFGDDVLFGFGGNDSLTGGAGNDILYGGGQGTTVISVGGSDTLKGGEGDDFHSISLATGGGSVIQDEQGSNNGILIIAGNTNVVFIASLADISTIKTSWCDRAFSSYMFTNTKFNRVSYIYTL
ncbi:MAG TPA: hypothetical protein V6C71_05715 [Coleofasciculaceae cyanobacterium]|jgi:hypothetical protein